MCAQRYLFIWLSVSFQLELLEFTSFFRFIGGPCHNLIDRASGAVARGLEVLARFHALLRGTLIKND